MKITNLMWRVEKRNVSDLKPWKDNPRKISKQSFEKLKERIKARGFHDVIKIDVDNTILSGNQRKNALLELGMTEVTVLIPDRALNKEEREKVALESNSNDGMWDLEKLKSFEIGTLADVAISDIDLASLWDKELEVSDENFNVDEEIKKIRKPKTKLGDLIQLGPHRIYCNDSTKPENLKRLFGKERASVIYSDPVYNLKGGVDYSSGFNGNKNYGGNVNDNRTDEEYKSFVKSSIEAALSVAKCDIHVFYYCDSTYIWLLQTVYRELGITNKRVCLWLKNAQNPTPGVAFSKVYEPVVYGVRNKPYIAPTIQNLNEVMNKEITTGNNLFEETLDHLDVWLVKRLSSNQYQHATSKPPKLHEKALRRCSKPGDIILDSFLGSGSTLIAGEQLKRKVYGLELEPLYCDLIIKRYEALTGIKVKVIHG